MMLSEDAVATILHLIYRLDMTIKNKFKSKEFGINFVVEFFFNGNSKG